jgi:hypothetical protein
MATKLPVHVPCRRRQHFTSPLPHAGAARCVLPRSIVLCCALQMQSKLAGKPGQAAYFLSKRPHTPLVASASSLSSSNLIRLGAGSWNGCSCSFAAGGSGNDIDVAGQEGRGRGEQGIGSRPSGHQNGYTAHGGEIRPSTLAAQRFLPKTPPNVVCHLLSLPIGNDRPWLGNGPARVRWAGAVQ